VVRVGFEVDAAPSQGTAGGKQKTCGRTHAPLRHRSKSPQHELPQARLGSQQAPPMHRPPQQSASWPHGSPCPPHCAAASLGTRRASHPPKMDAVRERTAARREAGRANARARLSNRRSSTLAVLSAFASDQPNPRDSG
jgi:hypothetical protein